jgi:hypothetical protein
MDYLHSRQETETKIRMLHPSLRKNRMRVYEKSKDGKRYSRPARYYEELRMKYGLV